MANKNIRMRAKLKDGETTIKALISHPMETGRRKDDSGNIIPAHFIRRVSAEHKGKLVFDAYWGTGVSQNPFVSFTFTGAAAGDTVKLSWVDNQDNSGSSEVVIK